MNQLKIANNELKISNENLNKKVIALENDLMQMKMIEHHSTTGKYAFENGKGQVFKTATEDK